MNIDSMMQFRLSYLQLVAWGWESPQNYAAIVTAADGFTLFTQLKLPRPPWTMSLKLSDPLTVLQASGFAPAATGGWIGPRARLTIDFPAPPAVATDHPAALASYYSELPSPFGEPPPGPQPPGVASGAGGHGMGHMSDALVLGGVIVRALAISWADASFRQQLIGGAPINGLLMDYLGYNFPWNMDLIGRAGASAFIFPQQGARGCWSPTPTNAIEMYVPRHPQLGGPQDALALAAYNQTGDQYPLTCP